VSGDKQIWVLAGGNGAGKSTFYHTQLQPRGLPFINADVIAKELYPEAPESHSYDAAKIAAHMRNQLLAKGESFCFETVFSHPSKIDFVAQAKANGYEVVLVFIHLDNLDLNLARIAQRVEEGGHAVPPEKVISRIPRTLEHVKTVIPLCDKVYILDNQSYEKPFEKIATLSHSVLAVHSDGIPNWVQSLLADYL
jgi:predicted ABC-type ATPase